MGFQRFVPTSTLILPGMKQVWLNEKYLKRIFSKMCWSNPGGSNSDHRGSSLPVMFRDFFSVTPQLVGGWTNPSEKYARQNGFIFPK